MKKLLVLLSLTMFAATLSAAPVSFSQWYSFGFTFSGVDATGCQPADPGGLACIIDPASTAAPAPPWTFSSSFPIELSVTDAFLSGDGFDVYSFGVLIGSTPLVATGASCGSDPNVCFVDPLMSHALITLPAGAYSMTIVPHTSPFQAGVGNFRVEAIPEPATFAMLAAGLIGLALLRRRHGSSA